jgi:hypothetical protein
MKWNGAAWACANDNIGGGGGGGTVTSVLAGTGLQGSPNPIVVAGSINLAPGYQLPQGCANGQVAKSNGAGGWTCQADATGSGTVTSVTAGTGLTGGTITTSGTVAVDTTYVQRRVSASCAVGSSIRVIAADGTVTCQTDATGPANVYVQGGNAFGATAVLGTTDNNALDLRANGARVMRYEPGAVSPNVIGGSPANSVAVGVRGATIAGGGVPLGADPDFPDAALNRVFAVYGTVGGGIGNDAGNLIGTVMDAAFATVGGGVFNVARGTQSTVGGGGFNNATNEDSTVGGGVFNVASGTRSTVGGGGVNTASGEFSTIPGGFNNFAVGDYSFAAGIRARALHHKSFVWGGSASIDTKSIADGDFVVYAPTAVRMFAGTPGSGGCTLTSGASGWSCSSDRALKSDIAPVDTRSMLERVVALPVSRWSFASVPGVTHVGPMAQDFHAAFGLGDDDTKLAPMDVQGVALAAIQGLNAKVETQARLIAEQARELAARDAEIALLRSGLADVRRAVDALNAHAASDPRIAAR